MKETLISFETAKLAKEKEFDAEILNSYTNNGILLDIDWDYPIHITNKQIKESTNSCYNYYKGVIAPTQSLLQRFIRENRGIHIEIHRNASGYYWSMCKSDGGTDLGWSDISGPNDSGVWDSFEDALENALQIQLSYDLPNDTKIIKHWGNYVEFALNK
jgi:hypothetical protein